jgi:hypothetical protein
MKFGKTMKSFVETLPFRLAIYLFLTSQASTSKINSAGQVDANAVELFFVAFLYRFICPIGGFTSFSEAFLRGHVSFGWLFKFVGSSDLKMAVSTR